MFRLHLQEEGQSCFLQIIPLIEYFRVPPQWDSGSVSHAISVIGHTLRDVILKVMHVAEALILGNLTLHVAGLLAIYCRPPTKWREGNVFTPVCHSVHRGLYDVTSCLATWFHIHSGGLLPEGVSPSRGCLPSEGGGIHTPSKTDI